MPEKDIARLQRVQNCLARVVTKAPRFSRSVPILKRLHWLIYWLGRNAQNIYTPLIRIDLLFLV